MQLRAIEAAALLHDVGKLAIPEHILNKPGRLTPAEFERMKSHARIGAEILSEVDFPYPVVPIVRHHHENWDGTGYPDGLKGDAIPVGARILAVVDCFDALTSHRPYRRALSVGEAVAIIDARRGTMYDPASSMRSTRCVHPAPRAGGSDPGSSRQEARRGDLPTTVVRGRQFDDIRLLSRSACRCRAAGHVALARGRRRACALPGVDTLAIFVVDEKKTAGRSTRQRLARGVSRATVDGGG